METIMVFGEILFDKYPDKAVIGGAPFNFCAHLAKTGHCTELISAVGRDRLGREASECARNAGAGTEYLNTVGYPTGRCNVTLSEDNIPSYDLCTGQAYDNITLTDEQLEKIRETPDKSLYFGTLAQRNIVSRGTLYKLLDTCSFSDIFYDVNIRQNYYSAEILDRGFRAATVLKMSRDEAFAAEELGISFSSDEDLCRKIYDRYRNIKLIILTLDKDGAMVYDAHKDSFIYRDAVKTDAVSSVGAGDSFLAGFVHGILMGCNYEKSLGYAVELSSYVVGHLGAVPDYDGTIRKILDLN